eukprot:TRINITY_DN11831_c0_g1_i1.p1 TRINITY_DN11831_c0_g1~~TRINITY_DN11831_c0_g1_i1.p1  ORF type:complete len:234 (+),score=75.20 TRINITY_DN11831_c0_g1_i1:107-808(+)
MRRLRDENYELREKLRNQEVQVVEKIIEVPMRDDKPAEDLSQLHSAYDREELEELREKMRTMMKTEIELKEKVEMLEQENRYRAERISALVLLNKRSENNNASSEAIEEKVRETARRYEFKINELASKLSEMERRNAQLEELLKINQTIDNVSMISDRSVSRLDDGHTKGLGAAIKDEALNELEMADLRAQVKDLRRRELDQQDKIELLERENKYKEDRLIALNQLLKKQGVK